MEVRGRDNVRSYMEMKTVAYICGVVSVINVNLPHLPPHPLHLPLTDRS
jgi:hypothetical protein